MVETHRPKPKVCVIQYNASRYLARVDRAARTLAEEGFEVVLIAIGDGIAPALEQRDGYVVKRVEITSRAWPRWTRPARWIEAVIKTYRAAYAEDADVYNPRDIYPMLVAQLVATRRRAAVVADSDELNLYRNWPWVGSWWWKLLAKPYEGYHLRRAAATITSDEGRADVLVAEYGIVRPAVVRNVPDVTKPPTPDPVWRQDALRGQERLLLYTGGLVANRGLLELVDAMRELPGYALAFVGHGHLAPSIVARIAEAGVADRVAVQEPVDFERLMSLTASADAAVIPIVGACLSYVYAAPNKLFESMAAGVPVVVSDLAEMARVVRGERVGTLIPDPTDPHSIAGAVRALFEGDEDPREIGLRAQRAALARHVWAVERPKLLAAWADVPLRDARRAGEAFSR